MLNVTNMIEQYYTIEEVAKLLKVVYLTVYRWIRNGKIEYYKAEKQYRIKHKDLEKFLSSYKNHENSYL